MNKSKKLKRKYKYSNKSKKSYKNCKIRNFKKYRNKKRNKTNKTRKGGVLNKKNLNLNQLEVNHEEDGDIAQDDIKELLPGLPQDKKNEEHGLGALRRQKWLENQDWESWKKSIGISEGLYIPSLPKHIREKNPKDALDIYEYNEFKNELRPWTKVKTKKNLKYKK